MPSSNTDLATRTDRKPPPSTTTEAVPGYSADITRTEFGIAHIVADDWGSLGFGQGYAYPRTAPARCSTRSSRSAASERSGSARATTTPTSNSDFAYRHLAPVGRRRRALRRPVGDGSPRWSRLRRRLQRRARRRRRPRLVRRRDWVQPITTTDLYANLNDITLFASAGNLIDPIATAQPPDTTHSTRPTPPLDTATRRDAAATPTDDQPGQQRLGDRRAGSETGGGMLIANPHFPWEGEKRLWESQLTLTTGELNVYGVGLTGVPGVLIGFNENVAWTHTVSAGYRMTLYELSLTPGDPTSYAVRRRRPSR